MGDLNGFVAAGYVLTWAALLGYARRLRRRTAAARRALDEQAPVGAERGVSRSEAVT